MDAWDALTARRNVRQFTDEAIPSAVLDQILEAGRRAPSSKNGQPWELVVVTDRSRLAELSQVWQAAGPVAGSAATIALVAPSGDDRRGGTVLHFDLGQLASTLTMAATALGVGSGVVYVHDKELAADLLGLPDDRFAALLVTLGYPADRPLKPIRKPNRRPFEDVVRREKW